MSFLQALSRLRQDTKGAEIAELAAVLPLLIVMIFGILWFGRALNIYTTINRATRAAAEAAAVKPCATCPGPGPDIKTNVVDPILLAAHLDPNQATYTPSSRFLSGPYASNVQVVEATISYPYGFRLNGITCCPPALTPISVSLTLHATAQAQEEN